MANKEVQIGINYTVNQQSLNNFKKSLESIRQLTNTDILKINPNFSGKAEAKKELESIRKNAEVVEIALEKAFNPKIGSVNLSKFNQELKKENKSIKDIYNSFNKAGTAGKQAFTNLTTTLMTTKTPLKQTHKVLNEIATTLGNNLRWNIASGAINRLTGSVQEAYGYIKALDSSLNSIQIVTQKSADTMADFAVQANNAAKALGTGTKDYTDAALTFYQQGLSDQDVAARTETTLKVANVTGLNSDAAAEYVTSVANGYKVAADEVENSMDKISAVGAATASSLSELAEGMSKVASTANAMGVSEDQLAATLSTVISVTRQDASTIGTAFKTIYARISDIEAGSEDAEVSLGEYTSRMAEMGFSVLDSSGKLKDLGVVMEEIGGSWANLSREQQISLAQTMAGTRQYNNLIALFDNWDAYTKSLNVSMEANGTLQKQQDTYMESTAAHLQTLTTNLEDLYGSLLDSNAINSFTDLANGLVSGVNTWVDAIGGGSGALLSLGSIAITVFSQQLGKGIGTTIRNFQTLKQESQNYKEQIKSMPVFEGIDDAGVQRSARLLKTITEYAQFMTKEEEEQYRQKILEQAALEKERQELEKQNSVWQEKKEKAQEFLNIISQGSTKGNVVNVEKTEETSNYTPVTSNIDWEDTSSEEYQENVTAMGELSKAAELAENSQKSVSESITKANEALKEEERLIEETNKKLNEKKKLSSEENKFLDDYTSNNSKLKEPFKEIQNEIIKTEETFETLKAGMDETDVQKYEESLKELKIALKEVNTSDNKSLKGFFDNKALQQKIQSFFQEYSQTAEKIKNKSNETKETLENNGETTANKLKTINQELQKYINKTIEEIKQEYSADVIGQSIVKIIGGFTQLISVINTFKNIGNIWNNEDISTGEKILQTIMAVGTALPMVVYGIKEFTNGMGLAKKALTAWGESILLKNAAQNIENATTQTGIILKGEEVVAETAVTGAKIGNKVATDSLIVSTSALGVAIQTALPPLLAITAAIAAIIGIGYALVKAWNADADAAKAAAENASHLKKSYEELKTSADELKQSISDYSDAIKSLEDLDYSTKEYAETLQETNKKAKELIETYQLFGKYHYENGVIVFNEGVLDDVNQRRTSAVTNANIAYQASEIASNEAQLKANRTEIIQDMYFGSGEDALNRFTNNEIADFAENIVNILEDPTSGIATAEEAFSKALTQLSETTSKDTKYLEDEKDAILSYVNSLQIATEENENYAKGIKNLAIEQTYSDKLKESYTTLNENGEKVVDEAGYNQALAALQKRTEKENAGFEESLKQYTDDIIGKFDWANGNQEYQDWLADNKEKLKLSDEQLTEYNIFDTSDDNKDLAQTYAKKILGLNDSEVQALTYKRDGDKFTFTDASGENVAGLVDISEAEARQALARQAATEGLKQQYIESTEDISDKFINAYDNLTRDITNDFGADFGNAIATALTSNDITKINLSDYFGDIDQEEYNQLINANTDDLIEILNLKDVNFEDLGYESADQFAESFKNGLKNWDIEDWNKAIYEAAAEGNEKIKNIITEIQSGDITAENIKKNEDWQKLIYDLDKIKNKDEELLAVTKILNNTQLVGTQEYAEALEIAQDKLHSIELESLNQSAKKALNEFTDVFQSTSSSIDKIAEKLKTLVDSEYNINIQIKEELDQEFNSVSTAIDNIKEKASLIGEEFVVSAKDIRELGNAFPGILEGIEYLSDGTIKLNEDIVQSAMAGAEAEVKADTMAAIEKLENQKILLQQKRDSYQKIADIALSIATGEISSEEDVANAKTKISEQLSEIETVNDQLTSQAQLNNAKTVADNSKENAETVAKNWTSAYQAQADASYQAAITAIDNANAITAKDKNLTNNSTIQVNYEGSTGLSSEATIATDLQNFIKSDDINVQTAQKIYENYSALVKTADAQINDYDASMAELAARTLEINNNFGNVAQGKGATGEAADQIDLLKDELDIYRAINNEIQDITRNLEDLTKQQEKLTGPALIKNLDKQLEILNKQADAYERKLKIAEQEASKYAAQLRGYGVTFDSSNQMANYDALYAQMENSINAQISAYNSLSKSQQTDQKKQEIENSKNQLEKLKEIAGKYDTVINSTLPEIINNLEDISEKEYEIKIEKLDVAIQEATDRTDWSKLYDEFLNRENYLSDDIIGKTLLTAQSSQTRGYLRDQMQTEYKGAQAAVNAMNIIDKGGIDETYGTDRAKALENAKTYGESLMSNIQEIYNTLDSLNANVITGIEEVDSAYSDLNSTYDNISKTYQNGMKLLKLLYGEDSYAELNNYYQNMQTNYEDQLMNLRNEKEYWLDLMGTVEENSDEWKKYQQNFISASDSLNSTLETALQNIIDKYTNTINEIFKTLETKVTNGLGLEYINDEWTLIKDNSEQYLDAINAAYNIQTTKSKYLEAINATDDVKAQQRLNKLMEEQMAQLKAKDKLTEYDVERAEKVLTLEQKKIALEEAQQNKSKMRLRRNASGDYTYQFVADEDNIAKAKQELLDAENDLYNFDLNEYNESLDRAYELYSEYQEKVLQVYTDTSLSQEERDKKLYLLNSQYQEALAQASERNTTARVNLENSANETIKLYYEDNLEKFNNMIDEDGRLIMEELVPGWSSGVQNMIDEIIKEGGLDNVMQKTLADANRAVQDLSEEEQKTAEIAGKDLADIQKATLEEARILSEDVVDAQDSVLNMAKDNLNTVMDIRDEYQNWANDILNTLVPSYDSLIRKINEAIARAQELAIEASRNYSINTNGYIAPPTSGSGGGSGSGSNGGGSKITPPPAPKKDPKKTPKDKNKTETSKSTPPDFYVYDTVNHENKRIKAGSVVQFSSNVAGYSHYKKGLAMPMGTLSGRKIWQVQMTQLNQKYPIKVKEKDNPLGFSYWVKNGLGVSSVKFDTGGYTGAWGADGRIAMLHQKELVLNAKDTENMLNAVDILRAMTDNLGDSIFNRLASIPNGYGNILNQIPNSETLEQKVQIEAVFPNVSNSHEIENAFNNLVNIASQRALRNKK